MQNVIDVLREEITYHIGRIQEINDLKDVTDKFKERMTKYHNKEIKTLKETIKKLSN